MAGKIFSAPREGSTVMSLKRQRRGAERPPSTASVLLVEEVVGHFDLGVGLEVVGQQHDGHGNLVQIVNLEEKDHKLG